MIIKYIDILIQRFKKNRIYSVLFIIVLIASVLVVGLRINVKAHDNLMKSINNELISIADIKIGEISSWYIDEISDAEIISENYFFRLTVIDLLKDRKDASISNAYKYLNGLIKEHSYQDIYLVDSQVNEIISTNTQGLSQEIVLNNTVKSSLKLKKAVCTDLYICNTHDEIHLDIACPMYNEDGSLLVVVVVEISPEEYLFPLIQKWPLESKTAETLIIREDGDSVLFLNELKHLSNSALRLRISKENIEVPAVLAVKGYEGIFEGRDYRNVEVLSYVNKIPGTQWYMIAKVDTEEIYSQLNRSNKLLIVLIVLIIVVLLIFLAFINSHSQKTLYKKLWLAQEEFKTTLYSIGDAVITTDKKGLVQNLNPIAEELTGWSEKQARGEQIETIFNIVNEETGLKVSSPVAKVIEEGVIIGLANHTVLISKKGTRVPISDSGAPIKNQEGEIIGAVLVFRDQSEERRNQYIVEEQKRQFFTLISNLPGIAYRCKNDEDWTMEFISKGCLDLTGYEISELIFNNLISYSELIHPADKDYVWTEVNKALERKSPFELEYRIITKNGNERWVWEKGIGVFDGNNLSHIEGFISDISARKEIEFALTDSEQLFHTLAVNSTVGIFKTDIFGKTTYVNPKWMEICGMSENEALGDGWLKHVHPDDREMLRSNWMQSLKNKGISIAEYRFVHANGNVVYVKGQAVPEFNYRNELQGYVGTITDISDLKNYEEKLKSSNLLLSTLIESIPDAIYVKDLEGRKVLANKADLKNIGISDLDLVIGKNDFDVFPLEIANMFWEDDQKVLKNGEAMINVEEHLVNDKNESKWLSTSKIPYKDANGKIIGLIGIGHDITDRKEIMVQLLEAKNKAEESENLKTSFLANMSHEIRTPLNSILGFTNILLETEDLTEGEKHEYENIVNRSSESLLQIINDIIDISSLETGQLKINPSSFNINESVNMLYLQFKQRIDGQKTGLELRKLTVTKKIKLFTDQNRLNQIFINLLTNAMKFTSSGYIEFGIERFDDEFVYFKVEDTGIGVAENLHDVIFERFRQADDNDTRHYGGNGLGLSIVKNLIELMGGNISLESEPNKGSVFRFYLPYSLPIAEK